MDNYVLTPLGKQCLQELLTVWLDFERGLSKVPIIARLEQQRMSLADYQSLLVNLRQQVIEGSRWISRSASSFDRDYSDVRSQIISHAKDEHRDYTLLENDFVASGGHQATIESTDKNIGSEALHGFLMYRASQPNPVDLIGAMWIIEGLGNKMASKWAMQVEQQLGANPPINRFMAYHGKNDEDHIKSLYQLIDRLASSERNIKAIIRTAKVVAKLYQLQLEEVDND